MKARPSMKSFVQSLYSLTNAFGYALGEDFTPLVRDPDILGMFVGLCGGSFGVGVIFWLLYHKLDYKEDEMNMLDARAEDAEAKVEKIREATGKEAVSKSESHHTQTAP